MADADIEISVPLDDAAPPKVEMTPEEGLEELRAKLAASESGRAAEAAARRDAEARAAAAAGAAQDSNISLIGNAIEMMRQTQGGLRDSYADALASGDYASAADINLKMSENSAKLLELERGKSRLQEAPRPVANSDPVEVLAQQLTPQSASWVRQHPEFARDPNKYQAMLGAHNVAVGRGIAVDTPEYFASVERTLEIGYSDDRPASRSRSYDDDATADAAQVSGGRRAAPPAEAPVSRSPGGPGAPRPGSVRLSAEEIEMAENMGQTPEDYARNKALLKKEGRIN